MAGTGLLPCCCCHQRDIVRDAPGQRKSLDVYVCLAVMMVVCWTATVAVYRRDGLCKEPVLMHHQLPLANVAALAHCPVVDSRSGRRAERERRRILMLNGVASLGLESVPATRYEEGT